MLALEISVFGMREYLTFSPSLIQSLIAYSRIALSLQANSPLTAFWIIHYICFIPGLLDRVRTEIQPAFSLSGNITNLPHLLNHCPLLNSIYHEVLRYTSAAVGIRQVEEDSIIGGYTFIEGAIVMMPVRPNHFDPNVFGDDVDLFVPERFIRTEEELSRTPGLKNPGTKVLKAFGGGTTLCPGRHFAANEILSSVAATLERFELDVVEGEKMAIPSSKEPTVGTYLADHDVKIRMRVRERR
jgi:cytochrome P450